ncbi:MAG TPA: response regulator [Flavisolibacter sp.]|jgi:CheY-like chemotaxis protein|nr:response regulator [Flavisolibacter sp.]
MLKTLAQPERKHTILHVDDDPDDLQMLLEAIQSIDPSLQIVQAIDGQQGLEKLRLMMLSADLPCLIVLDLNMPRINGKEAFKKIREDEKLSSVPIVILSTSNSAIDRMYFQGRNVEYITKPLRFDHLVDVASRLLSYCHS